MGANTQPSRSRSRLTDVIITSHEKNVNRGRNQACPPRVCAPGGAGVPRFFGGSERRPKDVSVGDVLFNGGGCGGR